jgi:hypothetical protein
MFFCSKQGFFALSNFFYYKQFLFARIGWRDSCSRVDNSTRYIKRTEVASTTRQQIDIPFQHITFNKSQAEVDKC